MDENTKPSCFLPYQKKWLEDKSRIKIWEKSRRIGATYVQAYEDVRDALFLKIRGKVCDVWFSSADITAAKEYIMYCSHWAQVYNAAVKVLGEIVVDEDKGVKALSIEFKNGARINALSSNPTQFRSKGGKVILDEFAHHSDAQAMWTAASASALVWGYPIRILSTHNGISKFYQFIKKIEKSELDWSHYKTTILDAVNNGLADKVFDKTLTKKEREDWINFIRKNAGDEFTWQQEYMCVAVDESTAFLSYNTITSCYDNVVKSMNDCSGELYLGWDIARKKDISVIIVLEKLGSVFYLRKLKELRGLKYRYQKRLFYSLLSHPNVKRACIDATGIGNQLAEDAQLDFGRYKVEPVMFTAAVKEELAYTLRRTFEDKEIRIPTNDKLTDDLHSVKKITTSSGNVRFDVEASGTDGHADRFWALALAVHAAIIKKGGMLEIRSTSPRRKNSKKYEFDYLPFKQCLRGGGF